MIKNRKLNRLKDYDYAQEGSYFVTVCTQDRREWFGEIKNGEMVLNEFGTIVNDSWQWLENQYDYVSLDKYVIMPDHFHGIIEIHQRRGGSRTAPTTKSLGRLIGAFKTVSTKKINQMCNTPGMPLWQRSFHDHIIRDTYDLNRVREYIQNNPLEHETITFKK